MVAKKLETLHSTLSCNLAARVMYKQSVRNPTAGPTLHFSEGAQVGQQRGDTNNLCSTRPHKGSRVPGLAPCAHLLHPWHSKCTSKYGLLPSGYGSSRYGVVSMCRLTKVLFDRL
jgi:hypothetical protein